MIAIRRGLSLLACALLLAVTPAEARGKRYALIVTVGDYSQLRRNYWLAGDLPSAPTDEMLMAGLMGNRSGFAVRRLKDSQATLFRVLEELNWLARTADPGDCVVIYISTHGSLVPLHLLDNRARPGAGQAGCVLLYDTVLSEPVLHAAMRRFAPGLRPVLLLDACFAAKLSKDVADLLGYGPVKFVPYNSRVLLDPSRSQPIFIPEQEGPLRPAESKGADQRTPYVRLAACRGDEEARLYHIPGYKGWVSAFTGAFVRVFSRSPAAQSSEQSRRKVGHTLSGWNIPQLRSSMGATDSARPLFAPCAGPAGAGVLVQITSPGRARISGGALMGIRRGDRLRLLRASPGAPGQIGVVRVERVDLAQAYGTVERLAPRSPTLATGKYWASARMALVHLPPVRLKLGIAAKPPVPAPLIGALGRIPGLTLVSREEAKRGQAADVVLQLDQQTQGLTGRLYAPGQKMTWTFQAQSEAELAGALRPLVNLMALRRFFEQLENPAAEFQIRLSTNRPDNRFRFDEPVQFYVTSDRDCYLHLLAIEPDGAVQLLFPNQYHPDGRIEAGKQNAVPPQGAERRFQILAGPPEGTNLVVAVASQERLDLEPVLDAAILPIDSGYKGIDPYRSGQFGVVFRSALAKGLRKQGRVVPRADVVSTRGWAVSSVAIEVVAR